MIDFDLLTLREQFDELNAFLNENPDLDKSAKHILETTRNQIVSKAWEQGEEWTQYCSPERYEEVCQEADRLLLEHSKTLKTQRYPCCSPECCGAGPRFIIGKNGKNGICCNLQELKGLILVSKILRHPLEWYCGFPSKKDKTVRMYKHLQWLGKIKEVDGEVIEIPTLIVADCSNLLIVEKEIEKYMQELREKYLGIKVWEFPILYARGVKLKVELNNGRYDGRIVQSDDSVKSMEGFCDLIEALMCIQERYSNGSRRT